MDKFLAGNRIPRHNDALLIKGGKYENKQKGLCSIGRTKTKSGRAETDKSKLNRK